MRSGWPRNRSKIAGMKNLDPRASYDFLIANRDAAFIDCRSESEYFLVGHPVIPGVKEDGTVDSQGSFAWRPENICYSDDFSAEPNDEFVHQSVRFIGPNRTRPVVIICRSGRRSVGAAKDLEAFGYTDVINVVYGFEGELNDQDQRGKLNGWRFDGLPWEQL
jgi:rhodanese-related sulfurtransferase